MKKTMNKRTNTRKKKKLSPEELAFRKEQRDQKKEIREIMKRIGFIRLSDIDGKEFVYKDRKSEIDDIFVCENIIILTEYTIGEPHLLKKSLIYNLLIKIKLVLFPSVRMSIKYQRHIVVINQKN